MSTYATPHSGGGNLFAKEQTAVDAQGVTKAGLWQELGVGKMEITLPIGGQKKERRLKAG